MDETIQQQLDLQTKLLQEILRRLSVLESNQNITPSNIPNTPPPSNSFALAHLRSLGEVI